MKPFCLSFSLALALGVSLSACRSPQSETSHADWEVLDSAALASSHSDIRFATHVKPILEAKCVVCHNRKSMARHSFESRKDVFSAAAAAPRLVPGNPEASAIIRNGTQSHALTMPPVGERLTENEKRILIAWVRQGAKWPEGAAGRLHADTANSAR